MLVYMLIPENSNDTAPSKYQVPSIGIGSFENRGMTRSLDFFRRPNISYRTIIDKFQ